MKTLCLVYHLMLADFRERVRRYSFLVSLLAIVAFTYLCLPAPDSIAWLYLNLGGGRPLYNSAWIGIAVTRLMAEFFPLFGFYLVKNTLERDRRTGVGEIIASTPITRATYTVGKWLSNSAVFAVVILVTTLTSLVLQFVRAEDFSVDLWALVSPFLFLLLPELAFIAALAVLFETISWLRGGFGNLIYYVVYIAAVLLGNLQGMGSLWSSVSQACSAHLDGCKSGGQIDIGGLPLQRLPLFRYEGVTWTADILWPRLAWLAVALGVALLAAVFFHRFDPSRIGNTPFARIKQRVLDYVLEPRHEKAPEGIEASQALLAGPQITRTPIALTEIMALSRPGTVGVIHAQMLAAELRLTFKGLHWAWYLIGAGIVISALVVPLDIARMVILPLAMVWPVLVWSSLGVRQVRHRTAPIIYSLPFPIRRQLLTTWLVGALIAVTMASTVVARLAAAGQWAAALAALIGALFVPSFAVALGCWSETSKLFQAVYLFVWYLASIQGVLYVDFMGHFPQAIALGLPWVVVAITAASLIAAALGRKRQVST